MHVSQSVCVLVPACYEKINTHFFPVTVVTAFQSCRLRKEVAFWCLGTAASILELSRILGLCELAYVDYKCGAKNKLQEPTASALPCSAILTAAVILGSSRPQIPEGSGSSWACTY